MPKRPAPPAHVTISGALLAVIALLALSGIAAGAVGAVVGIVHPTGRHRIAPRDPVGGEPYPHSPSFKVVAVRSVRRITAGQRATFGLSIFQRRYRGLVALRIRSRLPRGVLATLGPTPTRGHRSVLRIATSPRTPARTYRITIRAVRSRPSRALLSRTWGGRRRVTVRLRLIVRRAATTSVLVNGSVTGVVAPGQSRPIDMRLANPFGFPISVSAMSVAIARITPAREDPQRPCTSRDFTIRSYSGPPIRLARKAIVLLSDSRVPPAAWPQLVMADRPANQDGCKGARLSLSFRAAGRRSPR